MCVCVCVFVLFHCFKPGITCMYRVCLNISCESAVKGYEDSCRFLSNICIHMTNLEYVIILSVNSDYHLSYFLIRL